MRLRPSPTHEKKKFLMYFRIANTFTDCFHQIDRGSAILYNPSGFMLRFASHWHLVTSNCFLLTKRELCTTKLAFNLALSTDQQLSE